MSSAEHESRGFCTVCRGAARACLVEMTRGSRIVARGCALWLSLVALGIALAVVACGDDGDAGGAQAVPNLPDGVAPGFDASADAAPTMPPICNDQGFCWENPLP